MVDSTFITRVVLQNYKSIAACDVRLGPLTFLVGPNGSGKSNFLDALRFVADALRTSLHHALRDRGSAMTVLHRSGTEVADSFGLRLEFALRSGATGHYSLRYGAREPWLFKVQQEECVIRRPGNPSPEVYFRIREGEVVASSARVAPAAVADRLYLVNASGLPEFRPVYEAFSQMGFYNLNPERLREAQVPDAGQLLARDGSNIASVLTRISTYRAEARQCIDEYLDKILPGLRVEVREIAPRQMLAFRQRIAASGRSQLFFGASMSDGTLRALGILVALFQSGNDGSPYVSLVGIEEPEMALHPAAVGVLLDSLQDASQSTQIVVTSHSPDLLDDERLDNESILAVVLEEGSTRIGRLDDVGRSVLRDRLYTAGELLRLNQLSPDPEAVKGVLLERLRLFDEGDS